MTTSNVTPLKIERAMSLRRWCPGFVQATDTQENARDLSEAAEAAGVTADVVVDVDPGGHRTGSRPGSRPSSWRNSSIDYQGPPTRRHALL